MKMTDEPDQTEAADIARPPIFATNAPLFRDKGFWPRPVKPGSKACYVKSWQLPDSELPSTEMARWLRDYSTYGVGLLMGSPLPDDTRLGAVDVDSDPYKDVVRALLSDPVCGRIGKRGAVFFVRVRGPLSNPKFRVKGDAGNRWGTPVECLFTKLCVIPPTIHPETNQPYHWIGKSLLETEYTELPIVEMKND
jgi:hypothetical protein